MAKITADGLTVEFNNIISFYDNKESIKNPNHIGTYEGFDFNVYVKDKPLFNKNVIKDNFELCSGNIPYLIKQIDKALNGEEVEEFEFTEPDFEIAINKEEDYFMFKISLNCGSWNSIYGLTRISFELEVDKVQMEVFKNNLQLEWQHRDKQDYLTYIKIKKSKST